MTLFLNSCNFVVFSAIYSLPQSQIPVDPLGFATLFEMLNETISVIPDFEELLSGDDK